MNLDLTYGFGVMEKSFGTGFIRFDKLGDRRPDIVADFRHMPVREGQADLILFDPPHLTAYGLNNAHGLHPIQRRYGTFKNTADMRKSLYQAFKEIERLLSSDGLCVLKWNSYMKSLRWVLSLTNLKVETVHETKSHTNKTRNQKTDWVTFTRKSAVTCICDCLNEECDCRYCDCPNPCDCGRPFQTRLEASL